MEIDDKVDRIIKFSIVAAAVLAVIVTVAMVNISKQQPYSVLYIKSYSNYVENNSVSFVYGVESHEETSESYNLSIFFNDEPIKNESFEMDAGKVREQNVSLSLPLFTNYPAEIELLLKVGKENYTAHFWVNELER